MSNKIKIWNRTTGLPTILTLLAMSILAQLPHYYYLSEIMKLNQEGYVALLIAFPIFGAIGLTAVGLLISDYLMSRNRNPTDELVWKYILRGGTLAIILYLLIQILGIFFAFQAIEVFREGMPEDLANNIALKEVIGMSILLIIAVFFNPPVEKRR